MKNAFLTAACTAALLALSVVTAFADVAPIPEPVTRQTDPLIFVLIAAAVVLAAAVIVWIVIRCRKK